MVKHDWKNLSYSIFSAILRAFVNHTYQAIMTFFMQYSLPTRQEMLLGAPDLPSAFWEGLGTRPVSEVSTCFQYFLQFRQPLALDKMPKDVLGYYTADAFSCSLIQGMFSTFVDFIKALMNKDFGELIGVKKAHEHNVIHYSSLYSSFHCKIIPNSRIFWCEVFSRVSLKTAGIL